MILPPRNWNPSANRASIQFVASFRRTRAWRYTTTLSPFTRYFSGSQIFRPGPPSFRDVLLHLRNAAIGAGCWKSPGLNANDLRIEIPGYGLHVVAIDCGEELLQCFSVFGAHGSMPMLSIRLTVTTSPWRHGFRAKA